MRQATGAGSISSVISLVAPVAGQDGRHPLREALGRGDPATTGQLVEHVEAAVRDSAPSTTGSVSAGCFQSAATWKANALSIEAAGRRAASSVVSRRLAWPAST